MKNKFYILGTITLILSNLCYCFFTPINTLYIAKILPKKLLKLIFYINDLTIINRTSFIFKFTRFYIIDFLWFFSFCCFIKVIYQNNRNIQLIYCITLATLSEFSQLFFPILGTFDIADFAIYLVTAFFFYMV